MGRGHRTIDNTLVGGGIVIVRRGAVIDTIVRVIQGEHSRAVQDAVFSGTVSEVRVCAFAGAAQGDVVSEVAGVAH